MQNNFMKIGIVGINRMSSMKGLDALTRFLLWPAGIAAAAAIWKYYQ